MVCVQELAFKTFAKTNNVNTILNKFFISNKFINHTYVIQNFIFRFIRSHSILYFIIFS
jgi:hypothetical protein